MIVSGRIKLTIASIWLLVMAAGVAEAQSTFKGEKLALSLKKYVEKEAGESAVVEVLQAVKDQVFDEADVTAKCTGDARSFRGICRAALEFNSGGRMIRRVEITLRVKLFREAPQAARPLRASDRLGKDNLLVSKVEVTNIDPADLVTYEELQGAELKRPVAQGTVITRKMLTPPCVVRRGDKVTIVAQSGSVTVKTTGSALDEGAIGDTIKVRREGNSRGVIQGIIATDGTILIASQK